MFIVQLKDVRCARDLLLMFGLNETVDQLAMAVCDCMVMC